MQTLKSNSLKYLAIGPNDEAWGVVTTTVGWQQISANASYPAMQHPATYNFKPNNGRILDEYQLLYITEGCGVFESQSVPKCRVEAGTVILLFPGEWHNYSPDKEQGWSEYWIGFRGAAASMLFRSELFCRENALLYIGMSNSIVSLYQEAIRLAEGENIGSQQLISGIVFHLLGLIYYKVKNKNSKTGYVEETIGEARLLMRQNISHAVRVQDIAAKMGVGYSWFRQNFKRVTGISPSHYQMLLIISRAKELLVTSDMSIAEIAYTLGFENTGHFSTLFRKMEGQSPRQFRDENRLK
ncbi:MAG: AraC family transcriptional regulator [Alistipes sp.]|nr:AraC family transcriptional regulator [Alistipes sp.]